MDSLRRRYQQIYETLGREELQRGAPGLELLTPRDLLGGGELWLGFYTDAGLLCALERYGLLDALRRRGFEGFEVKTLCDDPEQQLFRLWSVRPACEEPLIELLARRAIFTPPQEWGGRPVDVLQIEWLQLQDPLADFDDERPPLPGQRLPGLGVGRRVFELLRNICRRLGLSGIITTPAFMHNAIFYGQELVFVDPGAQGRFLAQCRDILPQVGHQVGAASWALRWGLVHEDGPIEEHVAQWQHAPMLGTVGPALRGWSRAPWYRERSEAAQSALTFHVDAERLRLRLADAGVVPYDPTRFSAL
jgi:hypothetical protein